MNEEEEIWEKVNYEINYSYIFNFVKFANVWISKYYKQGWKNFE